MRGPRARRPLHHPTATTRLASAALAGVAVLTLAAVMAPGRAMAGQAKAEVKEAGIQLGLASESSPILAVQVYDITDWSTRGQPIRQSGVTPLRLGYWECTEVNGGIGCQSTSAATCDPRPDVQSNLGPFEASIKGYFDCTNTYNFPQISVWVDLTWRLDGPLPGGEGFAPAALTGTITDGTMEYLITHEGYMQFAKYK